MQENHKKWTGRQWHCGDKRTFDNHVSCIEQTHYFVSRL